MTTGPIPSPSGAGDRAQGAGWAVRTGVPEARWKPHLVSPGEAGRMETGLLGGGEEGEAGAPCFGSGGRSVTVCQLKAPSGDKWGWFLLSAPVRDSGRSRRQEGGDGLGGSPRGPRSPSSRGFLGPQPRRLGWRCAGLRPQLRLCSRGKCGLCRRRQGCHPVLGAVTRLPITRDPLFLCPSSCPSPIPLLPTFLK